jgi:hypothetical protein
MTHDLPAFSTTLWIAAGLLAAAHDPRRRGAGIGAARSGSSPDPPP